MTRVPPAVPGLLLVAVVSSVCWVSGCGPASPSAPEPPAVECDASAETAQVWGPWKLDLHGVYEQCEVERQNGRFQLKPALEFEVSQRPDADTPGTERLRLARSVEGFRFAGSVQGNCLRFELAEEKDGGAALGFAGTAGPGEVAGRFRGRGPGTCVSEGEFAGRFRQAAIRH